MGIRNNDQTQDMAQGAVIVAAIRSGGTFLTHCLSNHSMIHCDRGEPLHHESVWYQNMDPRRARLLSALLNQTGYQVSMCRITYVQALDAGVWKWLVKNQPKAIWLHRENVLRQAISEYINRTARRTDRLDRPEHTFEEAGPVRVKIDPALFLKMARGLREQNERVRALLPMLKDVYKVTYAQVVGGENVRASSLPWVTSEGLCFFLGVQPEVLGCRLKRVNPYPLREMIANWTEVEKAVKASEFAAMLEDEP